MRRRVERLESAGGTGFDLATAIEAVRARVRTLTPDQLRQQTLEHAAEMRGRAAGLNRLERIMLAGLERVLAA